MEVKLFEIRDSGTFIPAIGILCQSQDEKEIYLLRRSGYGADSTCVFLGRLATGGAEYDPYSWGGGSRTMQVAYEYIEQNWDKLKTGAVVCVEHILGERDTPKTSERLAFGNEAL